MAPQGPPRRELRTLVVHVWEARGLRAGSVTARLVLGEQFGRTATQHDTNNPIWMEEVEFDVFANVLPALYVEVVSTLPTVPKEEWMATPSVFEGSEGGDDFNTGADLRTNQNTVPEREYRLRVDLTAHLEPLQQKRWLPLEPTGEICLSVTPLWYSFSRSRLQQLNVTVVGCNIVESNVRDDKIEPYLVLGLADTKCKTDPQKGTLAPVWNQTFVFDVLPATPLRLDVTLMDWDWIFDKELGRGVADLGGLQLCPGVPSEATARLYSHARHAVGEVLVRVEGVFLGWRLCIAIHEAAGIQPLDADGPLCVQAVWAGSQEQRTSLVPPSTNPEWHDVLSFPLKHPSDLYLGVFQGPKRAGRLVSQGVLPLRRRELLRPDVGQWVRLRADGQDAGMLRVVVNPTGVEAPDDDTSSSSFGVPEPAADFFPPRP
eukprot:EG_transcript_13013